MDWIRAVTKVYRFLNERDRKADIEEVRKWIQPLAGKADLLEEVLTLDEMDRLVRDAFPEGKWQPAVAFSQTLLLLGLEGSKEDIRDGLSHLLRVWEGTSINYSALLAELRKRVLKLGKPDKSIVETLDYDPNKPSFFSSDYSQSGVDFFLNYLKFEEGVDVEGFLEPLRKLLEKDQNVEEFLRLCGIDELVPPEVFLERVEKAVDVFVKAREQGLDLEEVIRKWDELANEGGSRFVYLEEAVKRVADEEIGRKFWEEVEKVLEGEGVPVLSFDHHRDQDFVKEAFALGLFSLGKRGVELSEEFVGSLKLAVEILKKTSPSAIYSLGDVISVLEDIGLEGATSPAEVKTRMEVFASLSPSTLRYILSDKKLVQSVVEAIKRTVMRGFSVDKFVSALEETVRRTPSVTGFLNALLENVHKEEGA